MGVGGNEIDDKISSLLFSFIKIKALSNDLNTKKGGKLSSILLSIFQDENKLKINVEEFKQFTSNKNIGNNMKKILKFILETLHKELKKSEEQMQLDNDLIEYPSYENLISNLNNSIIQKLFFGIKKKTLKCQRCKNDNIKYKIMCKKKFLMPENEKEIDIRDLLKDMQNSRNIAAECKHCKEKTDCLAYSELCDLPEIFIMHFENKNNPYCILNYYNRILIKNETYKLIGFILDKDEKGKKDKNPNVFYKEKRKWFIYLINQNKKLEIKDIASIVGSPSIIFYKKKKTEFKNYFNRLSTLLQDKENIIELSNEHILPEIEYENYYLLNIYWYNKILKIYESEEKYNDEKCIISTIKEVKDITKLNINDKTELNENFKRRKKNFEKEHLFKTTLYTEENTQLQYPINFIPIKENILNGLLRELNISTKIYEKYLYPIKLGENYAFIKENNKDSGINIFVCYINENIFEVVAILKYKNENYFNNEIKEYISNKGGLEYYYQIRNLKINCKVIQKIYEENDNYIGDLINLKDLNNYMNKYKFSKEKWKEIGLPFENIKMSMYAEENISEQNHFSQ